jgi:DNA repair exonuclease SbcCD ATPase subunit
VTATPGGGQVGFLSLDQIEEELARVERKLAAFRDASRRSHAESSAEAAALREMGARAKEIANRPRSWRGALKRSDAAELEALRSEMRSRADAMNRTVEAMKSASAEMRELAERQQALSKRRTELLAQRDQIAGPGSADRWPGGPARG